jgi:hypothetical protein
MAGVIQLVRGEASFIVSHAALTTTKVVDNLRLVELSAETEGRGVLPAGLFPPSPPFFFFLNVIFYNCSLE